MRWGPGTRTSPRPKTGRSPSFSTRRRRRRGRADQRRRLPGPPHITLTAPHFSWHARDDGAAPPRTVTAATERHVPIGRPVVLTLRAADVIHSFWVPSLHGKKDLIPGRESTLAFRADRAGVYRGQCAEFCGTSHAHMLLRLVAEPADAFERWLASERAPATTPANDEQRR